MSTEVLKVEVEAEECCVCGSGGGELYSPEEYDAGAPAAQAPLRAMLLHINNSKVLPKGRFCSSCIQRTLEAYNFSTMLASKGTPPLSEKIRALRHRLHELTQKIDVFIVVGGGANGAYSEEDIIMVERDSLAAATRADEEEARRARNARGDHVYQCTVCPQSFQRVSELRAHVAAHPRDSLHSCWTCGAQFATHAAAAEHAAAHAIDHALVCYLCSETFQSQSEQRRHEAACPPRCPVCGALLADRAALRGHVAAHGSACALCFRCFADAAALQAHVLQHRQDKQFVCGYDGCILRFATRNNLMAHIRKCHGGEAEESAAAEESADKSTATCQHCSRKFGSVAAMKRHARVHRAEQPPAPAPAPANNQLGLQDYNASMEWTGEDADGKVEYLEEEALEDLEEHHGHL